MKKRIIYILLILLICFCLIYIFNNNYIYLINRIKSMFDNKQITDIVESNKSFQEIFNNFTSKVKSIFSNIGNTFSSWSNIKSGLLSFLSSLLKWLYNVLLYLILIIQVVLIIWIFFKFYLWNSNSSYKTSFLTKKIIALNDKKKAFKDKFKAFSKELFDIKKKSIILFIFLMVMMSGYGFIFLLEVLIYLYKYIKSIYTFTSYEFLFSLIKVLIVLIIKILKYNSIFENIILFGFIIVMFILSKGNKKLRKNKKTRLTMISNCTGVLNLITGKPSAGKSLSATVFTLDQEEMFIEELEEVLLQFESDFPEFNISYFHLKCKIMFELISDDELEFIKNNNPNILEDVDRAISLMSPYLCADDSFIDAFYRLFVRGSMISSSGAILEPFYNDNEYTHALDFDSLRWYKKDMKLYHEPYEVLTFYEMDKEFNSHDSKGEVSDDGTAAFFAMLSHICKRHIKVFGDYQSKDQLIKRIRDVSEVIFRIEDKEYKFPLFISLLRKPVVWLNNLFHSFIVDYKTTKEPVEKGSLRNKPFEIKRNDVGLIYYLIKCITNKLDSLYSYFDKYKYIVFYAIYTYDDDFSHGDKIKYAINCNELSYKGSKLYESCQYNSFFNEIKNKKGQDSLNLSKIPYWTSLTPGFEFYSKNVHQHFNNKLIDTQFSEESSNSTKIESGDFDFYG